MGRSIVNVAGIVLSCLIAGAVLASDTNMKIGTDRWPPYEDVYNRAAPGFSYEVISQVMQQMGITVEINEYPWTRALSYVYEGKTDALFSAYYNDERAEKCHFPQEPLTTAKYVLFINKEDVGRLTFDEMADLKGHRIGILKDAAYPDSFMDYISKNSHFEKVSTEELNFKKLVNGRVDYIVADYGNGRILMEKMGLAGQIVPLLSYAVKQDDVFIVFSKKTVTATFVQRFSDNLKQFKQTAAYAEIYKKYFGIYAADELESIVGE